MADQPAFPKPGKKPKQAVRVMKDKREIVNLTCKAGQDEYASRKRIMWERQGRRCCLEHLIPGCPGRLRWEDASFEHEDLRGGGKRDDRIEIDGRKINGVSHFSCNARKGSMRIRFNDDPILI